MTDIRVTVKEFTEDGVKLGIEVIPDRDFEIRLALPILGPEEEKD